MAFIRAGIDATGSALTVNVGDAARGRILALAEFVSMTPVDTAAASRVAKLIRDQELFHQACYISGRWRD